jgi:hypothetical protein
MAYECLYILGAIERREETTTTPPQEQPEMDTKGGPIEFCVVRAHTP